MQESTHYLFLAVLLLADLTQINEVMKILQPYHEVSFKKQDCTKSFSRQHIHARKLDMLRRSWVWHGHWKGKELVKL